MSFILGLVLCAIIAIALYAPVYVNRVAVLKKDKYTDAAAKAMALYQLQIWAVISTVVAIASVLYVFKLLNISIYE